MEEKKIEVTQEMIEAGVKVLQESGFLSYEMDGPDRAPVRKIFTAMINAAPPSAPRL